MEQSETTNIHHTEISEEQVVDFLKQHPDFFVQHEELLTQLQLAQDKGNAVSLVERQVSALRDSNKEMRSRLNELMEHAGKNDELLEKTQALMLSLLEAQNADILVATLQDALTSEFDIDFARLTLFGDKADIASRTINADDAYKSIPGLLKNNQATCGVVRDEEAEFLFQEQASELGSAAVIPLNFGQALGVLAIGSRDEHYFHSGMGTLFLSYIADVMSRLLLPYLTDDQ